MFAVMIFVDLLQRQKALIQSLPCVSMSIRNVPRSLNWTGGISDCKNFNTTSATPADSILDLFTTGERKQGRLKHCSDKKKEEKKQQSYRKTEYSH